MTLVYALFVNMAVVVLLPLTALLFSHDAASAAVMGLVWVYSIYAYIMTRRAVMVAARLHRSLCEHCQYIDPDDEKEGS